MAAPGSLALDAANLTNAFGGEFFIESTNGLFLDVEQPDINVPPANGTKVQAYVKSDPENRLNQKWRLVSTDHPGFYLVESLAGGKVLDIHSPDLEKEGAFMQVCVRNSEPQQLFRIKNSGNGCVQIVNARGLCLDYHYPDYVSKQNGGKVHAWSLFADAKPNQCWRLVPTVRAPSRPDVDHKLGWMNVAPKVKTEWTKIKNPFNPSDWTYGPPPKIYHKERRMYLVMDLSPIAEIDWEHIGWRVVRAALKAAAVAGILAVWMGPGGIAAATSAFKTAFSAAIVEELQQQATEAIMDAIQRCTLGTETRSHGDWKRV